MRAEDVQLGQAFLVHRQATLFVCFVRFFVSARKIFFRFHYLLTLALDTECLMDPSDDGSVSIKRKGFPNYADFVGDVYTMVHFLFGLGCCHRFFFEDSECMRMEGRNHDIRVFIIMARICVVDSRVERRNVVW